MSPSFHLADLEHYPVALFPALTVGSLRGDEVALAHFLGQILHKVVPNWKVVSVQETATRINRHGLAGEFTRMRIAFDQSNILDRDSLRKIGSAIGVRITQTRSSIMRLSLQLWDGETGELIWSSLAETNMANEAVSQDPVYLEDIARATLGSILSDFLNRRTASQYTTLNKFLNALIQEAIPKEKFGKEE